MLIALLVTLGWLVIIDLAHAAPDYQQTVLQSIYPAGAQQGQTVEVHFTGMNGGLKGADEVVVDGPPGVSVRDVQPTNDGVKATFAVAPDAAPGRRMVRVKGGVTGLTNFRWFFVGTLPERLESEKNNTPETAEDVETPLVVNGRVNPTLDQDCYRFRATAGQTIVAAVLSHGLDAMGYGRGEQGFSDTSLELLDESGRIVAAAEDTLGFDPLIEYTIPRDGWYTTRVSGMGYRGFPNMVYRLTLGEVPYPTSIFPVSARRGETVEIEFFGPNIPPGTKQRVSIPADDPFPVQYVSLGPTATPLSPGERGRGEGFATIHELPLLREDIPTLPAADASHERSAALPIALPVSISGRFDSPGEKNWYRLTLQKGESVSLAITAQRHLRSPVDTLLEVFDAGGELVASNDDGPLFQGECTHDFVPFDSHMSFTAKKRGDYFVCVSENTGAAGPRSAYCLSVERDEPDFRLFQWPDAVPIWGPGTTAAFAVELHRLGGLKADVELSVEGLPEGWIGSVTTAAARDYGPPRGAFGHKTFLTITAPSDAPVGSLAEFHVIGRAKEGDREIVRRAQALTLYMWQEPNRFRASPVARAAVAPPTGLHLEAPNRELTAAAGATIEMPVRIHHSSAEKPERLSLSLNRAGTHFKCSLGPQIPLTGEKGDVTLPFKVPANWPAGTYDILVADAWSSETRKGLPGPCTRLITIHVTPPAGK